MVGGNNNNNNDDTKEQGIALQRYTSKNAQSKGKGSNNAVTMVESNKELYTD